MTDMFELHEVAPGCWAAIAPGTQGPAVSNACIVDLGTKMMVIDTFMTSKAADELAAAARRLTGREAALVVNSHWHADHVRGNHVFAAAPIVGTRRMRELIAADAAGADAETALPDVLIEDRLEIVGERPVHVVTHGRGHTESDVFVHLPEDGVLIAGDLVWNGIHAKTSDGFPAEWTAVLRRLSGREVTTVIPGHGAPAGPEAITTMADYLTEIDLLVRAVRGGDLSPESAPLPHGTEDWADASRFRAGLVALARRG